MKGGCEVVVRLRLIRSYVDGSYWLTHLRWDLWRCSLLYAFMIFNDSVMKRRR